MAYRIRYEVRKKRSFRWLLIGAALAAVLTKPMWYWELVQYVGRAIDGCR